MRSINSSAAFSARSKFKRVISRRGFLKRAGASLGFAALPSLSVVRGESANEPGTGLPTPENSGIEHIIVVMMENRSFDHLAGWIPGADGKQGGLRFADRAGVIHPTQPLAPDYQGCDHADPDHSYAGGRIEFNDGACDGWLRAGKNDSYAIGYYTAPDLPFLAQAAQHWTVCDRYFSSIMAPTIPNRIYQHAAQTDRIENSFALCRLPTIWDRLIARGLSARYYFSDLPFLALWGLKYLPLLRPISEFFNDAAGGALPSVAFVEPKFISSELGTSSDNHPHADIRNGEVFLNAIYQAVSSSPNWNRSVLVINYDEWGGFFDHVAPASVEVSEADRNAGNLDGRLGFRVPCIVISPWSRRGHVAHHVLDHTSVLRMIAWRWNLEPLSVRDRAATNFAEVLDFTHAPAPPPDFDVPTGPFGSACPNGLKISKLAERLVITWTKGENLQSADTIAGPWLDVADAASPFNVTPAGLTKFYRVTDDWSSLLDAAKKLGLLGP